MLLCNLPEDILAIVLGKCAIASRDATDSLKRNLPLLAVCRQWRRLAIPLVYKDAFVQYGKQEAINNLSTGDPSEEEPTNVAVKTNLDLVAMNSCAHAVKRINIDVHCVENPFPGWREVIQMVRTVASRCRVMELKVAMCPSSCRFGDLTVNMAKYTEDIAEVGDALAALMPDVRRLDCGGTHDQPFAWTVCGRLARQLYGRLAGHYAENLRTLDFIHPIAAPLDCQFPRLKKLRANYEKVADYQLPQMQSEELVDVRLFFGPPNHSWASFSADSDSRVIEFTKLKKLFVSYHTIYEENGVAVRHRDGHPWRLSFPSLRNLTIDCPYDICPLLEYAVLPPRMESISIKLNSAAFQDIANLVLPETKELRLSIASSPRSNPSVLPVINRFLERARGSDELQLSIQDRGLPILPESITCTALTRLLISAPTSVDTMLAFFARLPRLTHVTFYHLDMTVVHADISVPGANEDAVVEPLHASLRVIFINYVRMDTPAAVVVALVKYMLLRIPTLTRLWDISMPKDAVLSFVEEYAPRYPHLRDVELKLN